MKTNILFISIAFPPKSDSECIQTAKYFFELQKSDSLSFEVITSSSPTLNMPIDKNLDRYDQGYIYKHEVPIFENKYTNFLLRRFLPGGIDWPDSKNAFFKGYKKVLTNLKQTPDIIYSRSFPLSSSIFAYKVQKELEIPWVMHLSDPWALSPLNEYTKKQRDFNERWERQCLEAASVICVTSELTQKMYKKKYPEYSEKIAVFPNVYDSNQVTQNLHSFDKKLKVVYTGGLVGKRSAKYFFDALENIKKIKPEALDYLEVIFAGHLDRENREIIERYSIPQFKHLGALSFNRAIELQKNGDLLLVIDNPIENPEHAVFFPSKLLDYFIAQRRIIAITTQNGTTNKILDSLNMNSFKHGESEKLCFFLIDAVEKFKNRESDYFYMQNTPKEYSADYNAKKLEELFKKLKNKK